MRKQIVKKGAPITISLDAVSDREIIGMYASDSGRKYILSASDSSNERVVFLSGKERWSSYRSVKDAIEDCLYDSRCTVFAFDNVIDLAEWIQE